MLEMEQKFAHADFDAIERRLAEWGARPGEEQTEADHYFNAPDRDFARTDEAFRLRRIGEANFLTYKGPKRAGNVKVRTELEIPLRDGDEAAEQFMQLLTHLGYRPVAVVRKHRRMRHLQKDAFALTVCLDEVDELGRFAEVEILAPEEQVDQVRTVLTETAAALGLTDLEPRSYLHLLLAARGTPQAADILENAP
ncbi:MAG TPA: class IV adenylate cyclase [Gemmataceae bacterium]|nr:class IV adenylate cyclase [Gemmataceae bacterium]